VLRLAAAKLVLPLRFEELRDRAAQLALEVAVGVDGLEARAAQRLRGLGLARAHEADEDELALRSA
jgi:hypothetical protein